MAAPQGIVQSHQSEQKILFRVQGCAQMDLGVALRRVAEQGIKQGATDLLVDLRQCTYMDSTFLGTLLFLQRAMKNRQNGRFALVAPSAQCRDLLQQMGLADVFPIGDEEELTACNWKALCADLSDVEAFKCNVMQAHVELACLPGPAGESFKKVARLMTQEFEAKKTK